VDRAELLARVRSLLTLKHRTDELERAESVLFSLARSIEGKDPYTHGHCERLSDYSARLGEHLGLAEDEITALRRAGVVHDIGKVAVPDAILLKPSRLTEEEWKLIKEHPVVGERICAPLKSFRLVLPIIRHHHEKLDGTGYPDGLRGEAIPITARVLQIVDVYDALTTERPCRDNLLGGQPLCLRHSV
jgi:putative two-component system response regulator